MFSFILFCFFSSVLIVELNGDYNSLDQNNRKQYCEVRTCEQAQKMSRSARIQQRAIDSAIRQIKAVGSQVTKSNIFWLNAIFPTRGPIQGGTQVHICGYGFQQHDHGRFGVIKENRMYCLFRLDQNRTQELSSFYGVDKTVEHELIDHEPLYAQSGIYKHGNVRTLSPGSVPSFNSPLTAIEEHYSKFLTSPATFINSQEVVCATPDISNIPIGFPVTAEVTLSLNGKEQFFQWNSIKPPIFTFYDQRSTRDALSTVQTYESKLGRKRADLFTAPTQEDIGLIRTLVPDTYTGQATGQFESIIDSRGEI